MQACVSAGIAKGEIVHVVAPPIRAELAPESLAVRHVRAGAAANGDDLLEREAERQRRYSKKIGEFKKAS